MPTLAGPVYHKDVPLMSCWFCKMEIRRRTLLDCNSSTGVVALYLNEMRTKRIRPVVSSVFIQIRGRQLGDCGPNLTVTFPSRVLSPGEACRTYVHTPTRSQSCEFTLNRCRSGSAEKYVSNDSGNSAALTDTYGTGIDACSDTSSDPKQFNS